jgi:hypothetical protein
VSSLASLALALVTATRVLYLNFSDGTERFDQADDDDAATNRSAIGAQASYPGFAPMLDAVERDELQRRVVAGVHHAFLAYDVQLTMARPAAGPYTMVVIGGGPGALGFEATVGGVAVLDCTNANESNIVFVFPQALRFAPAGLIATVAQEAAHSYGLEHSTNPTDFMYPRIAPTQERFADLMAPISGPTLCGAASQNSHQRLLAVLGPWPGGPKPLLDGTRVDVTAPAVRILSPTPDEQVTVPFTVTVEALDDSAITRVDLAAGTAQTVLRGTPIEWTVAEAPTGMLAIAATARDAWGNEAGTSVRVEVVADDAGCTVGGHLTRPTGRSGIGWFAAGLAVALRACRRGRRRL